MMKSKAAALPYVVWMVIFIVVPMALVVFFSFTDRSGHFTLENIANVGKYSTVFLRSIWLGALATLICLLLGAMGIANMWLAIFADVGVMIIAVLNAIRALFVRKL